MDAEKILPQDIQDRAIKRDREWGWKRQDISKVIEAAKSVNLASLGGQVQIIVEGGTCELYWRNYDSVDQKREESWSDYVDRSAAECLAMFMTVGTEEELVDDALHTFRYLREYLKVKKANSAVLTEHIVYVMSFLEEVRQSR
ncbi:MAG: hypothetical protein AAF512_04610 [Pseudomonadota bacterium]